MAFFVYTGKTDATEPSQNCSVWQLFTSDYQVFNGRNGADNSSYVRVNLDASAYEISNTTSYNGHIIYQACDGAENVDPLLFEESSSCDVEIDSERNQLLLHNCTEGEINPGDSRIILRSCLSFTDVCILGEHLKYYYMYDDWGTTSVCSVQIV